MMVMMTRLVRAILTLVVALILALMLLYLGESFGWRWVSEAGGFAFAWVNTVEGRM